MITRRWVRLRTTECTPSIKFELRPKNLDLSKGMAQFAPRVVAAKMGIVIRNRGWNNGNCPGFLRLVFGNAFNTRGSDKGCTRIHASHRRVRQSDERAGSLCAGRMRRALLHCEQYVDLNSMSILLPQFHDCPEGQ